MADVLTLGGITFTDFSPPESMPAGGKQAMIIHKLPGGSRVIDTLGPDEMDISWKGKFFGNDAYSIALALDAMRAAGQAVSLTWAGQQRTVIINHFAYAIRRLPVLVEYSVSCTVLTNPALGILSSAVGAVDVLVSSDLSAALAA